MAAKKKPSLLPTKPVQLDAAAFADLKCVVEENLTECQRRELAGWLKLCTTEKKYEVDAEARWLLFGLKAAVTGRGLPWTLPPTAEWRGPAGIRAALTEVSTLILARLRRPLRTDQRDRLGRIVADVYCDYCNPQVGDGAYAVEVLRRVRSIPQAIEAAFPGYLAAGVLYFIVGGSEGGLQRYATREHRPELRDAEGARRRLLLPPH